MSDSPIPTDLVERLRGIVADVEIFDPDMRTAARSLFEAQEKVWKLVPEIIEALSATGVEHLQSQLTAVEAELSELRESWFYLHKWVERGLFCPKTSMQEALECIAHHPTAPWKNGRWDVDHKTYAQAFYAKFPKAAALKTMEKGDE